MRKITLLLTFTATFLITLHAQVTIGVDKTPSRASILELKTQEVTSPVSVTDDSNVTSTKGGFGLPRVKLKSLTTLEPFIETTDAEWMDPTASKIKEKHAGLLVYNLNTTSPFVLGIYVWDGSRWLLTRGTASNGLNIVDGVVKLGGSLTEDTSIDMNNKALVVTTGTGKRMTVDGNFETDNLYILEAPSTSGNTQALTRNVTTGQIELAASIPPKLAFMQSATSTVVTDAQMQAGRVVPWATGDIVTNNELVELVTADNAFKLQEDAMIEISAYVCYIGGGVPYKTSTDTNREIVVNATIQVKRKDSSTWEDFSSVRGVYTNAVSYYINTLNVPPVMIAGKEGDMIRLIILRPPNETSGGYLGYEHGNGSTTAQIVRPMGTKFSKGLKIIAQ